MVTETPNPRNSRYYFLIQIILFAGLFIPLFIFNSLGGLDFWWWMSLNITILIIFSLVSDRSYLETLNKDLRSGILWKIFFGIGSAFLLFGIFYAGNGISRWLFAFAGKDIGLVYNFKQGVSPIRIILLMALLIGPGEEIIWRGYLQRNWDNRFGSLAGYLLSAGVYSLVHAASGNIMLVAAAAVCALFWGGLYLRYRSVLLVAVSHAIWDVLIFVLLPLNK